MTDKEKINISNVWGKIPINEINQDDCYKCIFGHLASICGERGYEAGVRECLKLLQAKNEKANLAHLILILRKCGSSREAWGTNDWTDYEGSFKMLEQAFESDLPSLRGADLRGADLREADLRGAYLRDADLRAAYLREADLYDADLRGADLSGTSLSKADLSGADLSGTDLREADLYGAKYNSKTVFPTGFNPENEIMVRV